MRFAEAVAYYQLDRNNDKSLKILTELKAIEPNMAELYAYSSYVLRRQGKIEESINELKRAIQLDPFNANYIDNLSQTYSFLHQYDKGIESARQGLSLIPDYIGFRIQIFWICRYKTGDLQVSLKESGLMEEDVQYSIYYYTRQYDKLIEFISKEFTIVTNEDLYEPKNYQFALIYYLSGNTFLSKIYADSAIIHLREKIKEFKREIEEPFTNH